MRATSLAIISAAWICTRAYGGESAGWTLAEQLCKLGDVVAADSPITGPLTELLVRSFGPRQIIAEQLAGLPGIERVFLFGSWAARYAGHPDRAPPDIDVLVIGNPDRDQLDEAAQRAGSRLAREVNVTVRSAQWWRGSGDGFHAEVAMRPLIPVFSDGGPQ